MTTKKEIVEFIDGIEKDYLRCWRVVAALRESNLPTLDAHEVRDFQPTLAEALLSISEKCRGISRKRNELIRRKKTLSSRWFRARMSSLSSYEKKLMELAGVGRSMGDAFAWIFYSNDRDLLEKHLERPEITRLPGGMLGGIGELQFIKNFPIMNDCLVVYHGNTSFLRIGDVSFVDANQCRVVGLGELKTLSAEKGHLTMYVESIAVGTLAKSVTPLKQAKIRKQSDIPEKFRARLKKQVGVMAQAFVRKQIARSFDFSDKSYYESLARLAKLLSNQRVAYEQAGNGLLLIGVRTSGTRRPSRLSAKAFPRDKTDYGRLLDGLEGHTKSLVEPSQVGKPNNANTLHMRQITLETLPGMVPIFWAPLPTYFLKELFFEDVIVMTLYNPAHFIKRLREIGLEVVPKQPGRGLKVYKITKTGRYEFGGMSYYQKCIQDHFMHEDAVVGIIETLMKEFVSGGVKPNTQIALRILQVFGTPPAKD